MQRCDMGGSNLAGQVQVAENGTGYTVVSKQNLKENYMIQFCTCANAPHTVTHTVRIHSNPLDPLLGRLALDYIDEDDLSLRLSDLFKVL